MRREKREREKLDKQNISDKSRSSEINWNENSSSGLIGEHDMSDTTGKNINRTNHPKDSVTGYDRDGQVS